MTTALEVSASGKTRPKLLVRDMSAEGVTNVTTQAEIICDKLSS